MSGKGNITEQLSAYLDGELTEADAGRVRQAVEADRALADELEELAATRRLLRSLHIERPGEDLPARVMARAEHARLVGAAHAERPLGRLRWVRYAATAAVLLVAASVGMIIALTLWSPPGPEVELAGGTSRDGPAAAAPAGPGTAGPGAGRGETRRAKAFTSHRRGGSADGWRAAAKERAGKVLAADDYLKLAKVTNGGATTVDGDVRTKLGRAADPDALSKYAMGKPAGKDGRIKAYVATENGLASSRPVGGTAYGVTAGTLVKNVGDLNLALAIAQADNEIIYTDRIDVTRREVEKLLLCNGIRPAAVHLTGAATKGPAARPLARANFYQANRLAPDQVQYEAYVTPEQMASVQKQIGTLRSQQRVSQDIALAALPESRTYHAAARGRSEKGAERGGASVLAKSAAKGVETDAAGQVAAEGATVAAALEKPRATPDRTLGETFDVAKKLSGAAGDRPAGPATPAAPAPKPPARGTLAKPSDPAHAGRKAKAPAPGGISRDEERLGQRLTRHRRAAREVKDIAPKGKPAAKDELDVAAAPAPKPAPAAKPGYHAEPAPTPRPAATPQAVLPSQGAPAATAPAVPPPRPTAPAPDVQVALVPVQVQAKRDDRRRPEWEEATRGLRGRLPTTQAQAGAEATLPDERGGVRATTRQARPADTPKQESFLEHAQMATRGRIGVDTAAGTRRAGRQPASGPADKQQIAELRLIDGVQLGQQAQGGEDEAGTLSDRSGRVPGDTLGRESRSRFRTTQPATAPTTRPVTSQPAAAGRFRRLADTKRTDEALREQVLQERTSRLVAAQGQRRLGQQLDATSQRATARLQKLLITVNFRSQRASARLSEMQRQAPKAAEPARQTAPARE